MTPLPATRVTTSQLKTPAIGTKESIVVMKYMTRTANSSKRGEIRDLASVMTGSRGRQAIPKGARRAPASMPRLLAVCLVGAPRLAGRGMGLSCRAQRSALILRRCQRGAADTVVGPCGYHKASRRLGYAEAAREPVSAAPEAMQAALGTTRRRSAAKPFFDLGRQRPRCVEQ